MTRKTSRQSAKPSKATKRHDNDRQAERSEAITLTDEQLDDVVAEVSSGTIIENGREVRYYKVPNRSAVTSAPSLAGFAAAALPDAERRAREKDLITSLFQSVNG